MKKIAALLVFVLCTLALTGCGLAWNIIDVGISAASNMLNPDYESEPETFYSYELRITLTDRFLPYPEGEMPYAFKTSGGTMLLVEKNIFMYSDYTEGLTLTEYAEILREQISSGEGVFDDVTELSEVKEKDGLVYLTVVNGHFPAMKYLVSLHVGAGALWVCYFEQTEKNYDKYEPYFLEWASSVKISNTNSEV